jgi:pimeloyl-ACP methyl ester carboxylesterase
MRASYDSTLDAFIRFLELPGADPPNVFLHGIGRSSVTMAHVATNERLRSNRALLVDLFGFGISDKPADFSYEVDDQADAVVRLFEAIGVSRCRLIGHSLGGAVAVLVAARRSHLVETLVVAEGNLDPGGAPLSIAIVAQSEEEYVTSGFQRSLDQMREEARANPASIFATTLGVQQIASPYAMYRTARSLVELTRPTIREQLLALDLPRAFIVGAWTLEAEAKPPSGEAGEGLEGTGVRVIVVPDAGHPMMFQNPDGFAAAIAQALEEA